MYEFKALVFNFFSTLLDFEYSALKLAYATNKVILKIGFLESIILSD